MQISVNLRAGKLALIIPSPVPVLRQRLCRIARTRVFPEIKNVVSYSLAVITHTGVLSLGKHLQPTTPC